MKCGNCEKCEVSVLDNTTFCKSIKDDRCDKVKQKHKGSVMLVDPTNHVVCHPKSCVPHPEAICEVDECNSCSGRWKSGQKYLEAKDCREVTTTVVPPTTEPVPEDKP